jgi:hypothetical protein
MQGSCYTIEDRKKVAEAFADLVEDIKTYTDLQMAANQAGINAIGKKVTYRTIRNWRIDEKEDPDLVVGEMIDEALLARAEKYLGLAIKELENIEDFWEQPNLTIKGEVVGLTRERMMSIKKAQLRIENYRWFASKLAPEVYGDYYYEIKKVEEQIKSVKKQIDEISKK